MGSVADVCPSTETAPGDGSDAPPVRAGLAPGDVLAARFRLLRPLGEGGIGVVFEAEDLESGVRVALKALRVPRARRARLLKREFRRAQAVDSPYVVALHELFVDGDTAFLTMDLVDGVPLTAAASEALRSGDEASLFGLFRRCALGVRALHDVGLLHLDIKPSNVLARRDGHVTLLDLGLATPGGERTRGGTRGFMAPEQRAGRALTAAADWYAFGRLLHDALDGHDGAPEPLRALAAALVYEDPAARPSGDDVLRALAGTVPLEGVPSAPAAAFVGRDQPLARLHDAIAAVRGGQARVVVVRGAAGIGKSSLVRHALRRIDDEEGVLALGSVCSEYESVPFNAFDPLIDQLAARLAPDGETSLPASLPLAARIFPALQDLLPPGAIVDDAAQLPREQRQAAFQSLGALLAWVAQRRTLVLWIDDAHSADEDSVDLLETLLALRPPPPLLLVTCWRDANAGTPPPFVAALREERGAWALDEVPLEALAPREAEELARALLASEAADALAGEVARESDGNPLLLETLAAVPALRRGQVALGEAILRRVDELGPDERAALELLSAWAGAMPSDVARRVAAALGGRAALKRLCDLRLARWTAHRGALDVGHARVREELYASLDEDARRARHARLVDVLLASPDATVGSLAEHMVRAGDPRALSQLRAAADDARAALAFAKAVAWLEQALQLPSLPDDERGPLYAELGWTLEAAGRGRDAAAAYLRAADLADSDAAHEHRRAAAEQLLCSGRREQGMALLHDVLDDAGVRPPRSTAGAVAGLVVARLRLRLRKPSAPGPATPEGVRERLRRVDALAAATDGHMLTDTLRGAWFAAHQLLEAQRAGDVDRLVRAGMHEALYLGNEGTANAARLDDILARTRQLGRASDDPATSGRVSLAVGFGSLLVGRWRVAEGALRDAEVRLAAPEAHRFWELSLCRKMRLVAAWFTGRLPTLDELSARWLADAVSRDDEAGRRSLAADRPLCSLVKGRVEAARAELAALEGELGAGGIDEPTVVWLHNRMCLGLYAGDPPEVLLHDVARLRPFFRSLLATGQLIRVTSRYYAGQCLLAAAARGDRRQLRGVDHAAHKLRREDAPYATCYATLLEAGAAHLRGDDHTALASLQRAAAALDEDGQPAAAHAARWRSGQLLGGDEGRERVAEAENALLAMGFACPRDMVRMLAPGFPSGFAPPDEGAV